MQQLSSNLFVETGIRARVSATAFESTATPRASSPTESSHAPKLSWFPYWSPYSPPQAQARGSGG